MKYGEADLLLGAYEDLQNSYDDGKIPLHTFVVECVVLADSYLAENNIEGAYLCLQNVRTASIQDTVRETLQNDPWLLNVFESTIAKMKDNGFFSPIPPITEIEFTMPKARA